MPLTYVDSPIGQRRLSDSAFDPTSVFQTTALRLAYLTNPTRYAAQIVGDEQTNKAYILNSTKDAWLEIGTFGVNAVNSGDSLGIKEALNFLGNLSVYHTGAQTTGAVKVLQEKSISFQSLANVGELLFKGALESLIFAFGSSEIQKIEVTIRAEGASPNYALVHQETTDGIIFSNLLTFGTPSSTLSQELNNQGTNTIFYVVLKVIFQPNVITEVQVSAEYFSK